MNLTLQNFKCFNFKKIDLPSFGLVLINGESGSGKSTILQAIGFCFKNLGSSKISDFNNKKTFSELTIENECKIIRYKRPNKLHVLDLYESKEYFDQLAQAWLDLKYNIGYIDQNGYDSFLVASSKDRREYLEKIAGVESEDILKFELKISNFKKKLENDILKIQTENNYLLSLLDSNKFNFERIENFKKNNFGQENIKEKIKEIILKFENEKIELNTCLKNQNKWIELESRKKKLIEEKFSLEKKLENVEERKHLHKLFLNKLKIKKIQEKIKFINFENAKKIIEFYNIEKNKNEEKEKYLNIIKQFEKFEPCLVKKCPYCFGNLKFSNNKLEKTIEDEFETNPMKRKRTFSEDEKYNEAKILVKKIKTENISYNDFENAKKQVVEYENLNYELEKIGSEYLRDDQITIDEVQYSQDLTDEKRLFEINLILDKNILNNEEIKIDDSIITKIETISEKIKYHKELFEEFLKYNIFLETKNNFEIVNEKLKLFKEKKINVDYLISTFNIFKNREIDQMVGQVQDRVNKIVSKLFSQPINIFLSCWKNNKKSGEDRPGFEILINFNGCEFNLNELSGGEKSRISIAFSCTLAEINQCKILMFDESLSGLDIENNSNVILFLKEWANENQVLIILVSHNSIGGFFDLKIDI